MRIQKKNKKGQTNLSFLLHLKMQNQNGFIKRNAVKTGFQKGNYIVC